MAETFHADVSFDAEERAEIVAATDEWRRVSAGRVDYRVEFDLDFGSPYNIARLAEGAIIVRLESWMTPAQAMPKALAWCQQMKHPRIFMVADKTSGPYFKWVMVHEMGHAAGLERPECKTDEDCAHLDERGKLMSAVYEWVTDFTDADIAMCRSSGLCP